MKQRITLIAAASALLFLFTCPSSALYAHKRSTLPYYKRAYFSSLLTNFDAAGFKRSLSNETINLEGNLERQKLILQWSVDDNEAIDLFEVEKSSDGKTFTMAGLVFTSDKQGTERYIFKDKEMAGQIMYYRLKSNTKTKICTYSKTIAVKTH